MVRARVESGGRMTAMAVFGEEAGTRGGTFVLLYSVGRWI